jgi:hypothetical protein
MTRKKSKVQKLNERRIIGDLCKRKHQAPDTKRVGSVRFANCRTCCTCNALSVVRRKAAHKKYRDEHKDVAAKYHELYYDKNKEERKKYHAKHYLEVIKPREEARKKNAETS